MQQTNQQKQRKKSLCRFYVRGLCVFKKQECRFSHGIDDIDYDYWHQGQQVEYDYLQNTDFCQKKAIKGPRIYINLYQFQEIKKYTLQQLNQQRPLRVQIRNQMHHKLFHDFIQLLEDKFPGANLTEEMLMRQYTRVGFNKLMTRIKFSNVTSFLCGNANSKYYKKTMIMPPKLNKQTSFIIRKANQDEILTFYRNQYRAIMDSSSGLLDQATIKKRLYQIVVPNIHIPPLLTIMKQKKISFNDVLQVLNGISINSLLQKIKLQAKPQEMIESAKIYINKNATQRLVNWNDLYTQLSKEFKINNGNILNQVKPLLVVEGYQFFYFPMNQFIYHQNFKYPFEQQTLKICPCEYHNLYGEQQIAALVKEQPAVLQQGESVDINNMQTLIKYGSLILKSKIVGVDLEGSLRKGGFVQLIQINNERNTFLFDIFWMSKNNDNQTINLTKILLRNILANQKILKIFHDSRHDSLALHQFMQTCVVNVFDTSATETVIMQIKAYNSLKSEQKDKLSKAKSILSDCVNIKTLGLNQIFKRYNASHGINRNKQKFHKMWSQGQVNFFCQRPMDKDYREYCIKDVLDLPEIYHRIVKEVPRQTLAICQWLSSNYIYQGYLNSSLNYKEGQLQII